MKPLRLITTIVLLLIAHYTGAQNFVWAKGIVGDQLESLWDITLDSAKNIYAIGNFRGTIDCDPNQGNLEFSSRFGSNIYFLKLKNDGTLVWAKHIKEGGFNDQGRSINIGDSSNLYIAGYIQGLADFDPGLDTFYLDVKGSSTDAYVAKYDLDGELIWAKSFGGYGTEFCFESDIDQYGNVYTLGTFQGTVDFNPGVDTFSISAVGPTNASNVFISKLTRNGDFVWAKALTATLGYPTDIKIGKYDDIYISGYFRGTADLDPGPDSFIVSSTYNTAYIVKLDTTGNFIWAKVFEGRSGVTSLAIDQNGIYSTGWFLDTVDFDPGLNIFNLSALGSENGFITKLDTAGAFEWAYNLASTKQTFGKSIFLDGFKNTYITGVFRDKVDFDPGVDTFYLKSVTSNGDAFILKLDSTGSFDWAAGMGGKSTEEGIKVVVDENEAVYLGGDFLDTADFDPGPDTFKLFIHGVFIEKLSPCVNDTSLEVLACNEYLAPDGELYTKSGNYSASLITSLGCDSLIRFNLQIHESHHISVDTIVCDSFLAPDSQVYDTSGTYIAILSDSVGCDSFVTYNVTIRQSTYDTLNIVACDRFMASDSSVFDSSGTYLVVVPNYLNCDSFITLNLTINKTTYDTISTAACDSFIAPDSNVYYSSGIYQAIIPNSSGCDSVLTINLQINKSDTTLLQVTACDSFIAPDGRVYYSSGNYTAVLQDSTGCDSLIVIDLKINNTSISSINATVCDSFIGPGRQVYRTSGSYKFTLTSSTGCDSIINLTLKVNKSYTHTIYPVTCKSFIGPNGNVYTMSGNYTIYLGSSTGCDSILHINLLISPVDTAVTQNGNILIANAASAQYQWLDCNNSYMPMPNETGRSFIAAHNGSYAVAITQYNCVEKSSCYLVNNIGLNELPSPFTFKIYPNPAGDFINIEAESAIRVSIYNTIGELVYQSKLKANVSERDISTLAAGIYHLKLENNKGIVTQKLVISR